jgi:hypothetical protein
MIKKHKHPEMSSNLFFISLRTRKSVTGGSMIGERIYPNNNIGHMKETFFKSTAFVQYKKPDMTRQLNKQFYC